jgi:hypothetical protein
MFGFRHCIVWTLLFGAEIPNLCHQRIKLVFIIWFMLFHVVKDRVWYLTSSSYSPTKGARWFFHQSHLTRPYSIALYINLTVFLHMLYRPFSLRKYLRACILMFCNTVRAFLNRSSGSRASYWNSISSLLNNLEVQNSALTAKRSLHSNGVASRSFWRQLFALSRFVVLVCSTSAASASNVSEQNFKVCS